MNLRGIVGTNLVAFIVHQSLHTFTKILFFFYSFILILPTAYGSVGHGQNIEVGASVNDTIFLRNCFDKKIGSLHRLAKKTYPQPLTNLKQHPKLVILHCFSKYSTDFHYLNLKIALNYDFQFITKNFSSA